MGITGLLSFLEKSSRKTNINEFAGQSVAIDSYCWLHKGIYPCADKLLLGEPTDGYIIYCMKFIRMLLKYNIKPILVFDGRHLPAKAETEAQRHNAIFRGSCILRLNPPTADVSEEQLHYAGDEIDPDKALQLAYGNCDPFTFEMLHDFDQKRH